MRHEQFLHSLREAARGDRKNSVTGLLSENQRNRPSGYFNGAWPPAIPPELRQRVAQMLQAVLRQLPAITNIESFRALDVVLGEVLDSMGLDAPE